MTNEVLTEYVTYLSNQRTQLEATIFQLQAKIKELEKPKVDATDQEATSNTTSGS